MTSPRPPDILWAEARVGPAKPALFLFPSPPRPGENAVFGRVVIFRRRRRWWCWLGEYRVAAVVVREQSAEQSRVEQRSAAQRRTQEKRGNGSETTSPRNSAPCLPLKLTLDADIAGAHLRTEAKVDDVAVLGRPEDVAACASLSWAALRESVETHDSIALARAGDCESPVRLCLNVSLDCDLIIARVEAAVAVEPKVVLADIGGRPFRRRIVPSSGSSTVLDLLAGDHGLGGSGVSCISELLTSM